MADNQNTDVEDAPELQEKPAGHAVAGGAVGVLAGLGGAWLMAKKFVTGNIAKLVGLIKDPKGTSQFLDRKQFGEAKGLLKTKGLKETFDHMKDASHDLGKAFNKVSASREIGKFARAGEKALAAEGKEVAKKVGEALTDLAGTNGVSTTLSSAAKTAAKQKDTLAAAGTLLKDKTVTQGAGKRLTELRAMVKEGAAAQHAGKIGLMQRVNEQIAKGVQKAGKGVELVKNMTGRQKAFAIAAVTATTLVGILVGHSLKKKSHVERLQEQEAAAGAAPARG